MNQLLIPVLLLSVVLLVIYLVNQTGFDVIPMNGGDPRVFLGKEKQALDHSLWLYDRGKVSVQFLYPVPIGWVKKPIKGKIPLDVLVDFSKLKITDLTPNLQPLYSSIMSPLFVKSISAGYKKQIPNLTTDGNNFRSKKPNSITDIYANIFNRVMLGSR